MLIQVLQERQNSIRIVLIALFIAISQFISAQKDFQKELSWGVNSGLTFASVNFTPSVRQSKLNQGAGGFSVRYISEKNVGLLFELNYSQRGWKEYDPDQPEKRYSRNLSYLELPAFTHLYYSAGKHFRLIANFGPQIGYFLNEKILESNIKAPDRDFRHTATIQRRFDWGLCFGGGIEFRTGIGSFILDGRYYYGLSDIFNNTRADKYAASSNQVMIVKLTFLI